jgi:uncharacterized protein
MDLSRKLERLDRARAVLTSFSHKASAVAAAIPILSHGAPQIDHGFPRPPQKLRIKETWLEPDYCHGRVPIARARTQSAALFAKLALDPALADVDLSRALFLDTETTGLSGGTGTLAFLIGLARFVDDSLLIEQLLLPEPGDERAMLEVLRARVAEASCLITYNGKAFDWPLLCTRLVLQRLPAPPIPAHLDLLHCARRVYKRRLGETRLVHIEEQVLGMRRERDVEGFEIPGIYWSFVRSKTEGVIAPVVEHNANDLVALAAMMVRMGESFLSVRREDDPLDHYSMACVAMRAEDHPRAAAFACAAAEGGGSAEVTAKALELAARIDLLRGELSQAIEKLKRALELAHGEALLASALHLKLAKLYEHRVKDLLIARYHARFTLLAEGEERHEKRARRLERRLLKLEYGTNVHVTG